MHLSQVVYNKVCKLKLLKLKDDRKLKKNKIDRKEVKMNKTEVYQKRDIIEYVGGSEITCCHPSTTPNKLYTIYDEFDIRYYYKMMKEGIYQEIEEGILFQIKRFIEGD